MLIRVLSSMLLIAMSVSAYAVADASVVTPEQTGMYLSYISKVLIFLFMTGVVIVVLFKYKKISLKPNSSSDSMMQVVNRMSLGQKGELLVIKAGNEYLLLGTSMSNINYLKDVSHCGIDFTAERAPDAGFSGVLAVLKRQYKDVGDVTKK